MKILVQAVKDNHLYGFKSLFEAKRHQWVWWEENHTSAFDAFDELQPDLFIGCGSPSRAIQKCLQSYRTRTRAIFQVGPYTYSIGEHELYFPFLVNQDVHKPGTPNPKLVCDIGCCESPHPYLINMCHPLGKFNIKILGDERWPVPQYLGKAQWSELVQLYQSSTIVFANKVEELGRAIACGAVCITANSKAATVFGNTVIHVDSKETMMDECHQLLTSRETERVAMAKAGPKLIEQHKLTYIEAFAQLCDKLKEEGIKI